MRQELLVSLSLLIASTCSSQDGALDPTFTPGTGPNTSVAGYVELASGKLLVCGTHQTYDGVSSRGVSRISQDGVLDTTFNVGTGSGGATVSGGVELPDGRILIVGGFLNFAGDVQADRMAMLLPDGSPDPGFDYRTVSANPNGAFLRDCVLLPDGKIMIAGEFDAYDGVQRGNIARINQDGSLDMSFDPGLGTGAAVLNGIRKMVLLPDGKLLIVGNFTTYNGVTRRMIARINPDGSLDTSFDTGNTTSQGLQSCLVQPDGKILVGGIFSSFAGVPGNNLVRLNADGPVDTSFNAGTSAVGSGGVNDIALQSDGKVLICGYFGTFFNGTMPYMGRLMPDGSPDPTFLQGMGLNHWVRSIQLQASGKLLVGTDATDYNGTAIGKLVRLNAGPEVGVEETRAPGTFAVYPNPAQDEIHLPTNSAARTITLLDALGRPALRTAYQPTVHLDGLPSGLYFMLVQDAHGREIARAKILRER